MDDSLNGRTINQGCFDAPVFNEVFIPATDESKTPCEFCDKRDTCNIPCRVFDEWCDDISLDIQEKSDFDKLVKDVDKLGSYKSLRAKRQSLAAIEKRHRKKVDKLKESLGCNIWEEK